MTIYSGNLYTFVMCIWARISRPLPSGDLFPEGEVLKQVLQRKLQYARITGGLYPPEITAGQCDECGLLCIRCSPVAGAVEVRMVQKVRCFGAELDSFRLLERKGSRQAGVHVEVSGPAEHPGPHVSDGARSRSRESITINPIARWVRSDQIVRALVAIRIPGYLIRALIGCVDTR